MNCSNYAGPKLTPTYLAAVASFGTTETPRRRDGKTLGSSTGISETVVIPRIYFDIVFAVIRVGIETSNIRRSPVGRCFSRPIDRSGFQR